MKQVGRDFDLIVLNVCIVWSKMVRSLSHWTKTLSFPARISPNKQSKENVMNLHPSSPTVTPTPSNNSLSPPCNKHNEINNMKNNNSSLTEVSYHIIIKSIKNVQKWHTTDSQINKSKHQIFIKIRYLCKTTLLQLLKWVVNSLI